ncbi:hypothetical protein V5048_16340, partial [Moellerella wisconsensis]
ELKAQPVQMLGKTDIYMRASFLHSHSILCKTLALFTDKVNCTPYIPDLKGRGFTALTDNQTVINHYSLIWRITHHCWLEPRPPADIKTINAYP